MMGVPSPAIGPRGLAEAAQKGLDGTDLGKHMEKAGRKKALREFTLDRMLRETERVYGEVLGK